MTFVLKNVTSEENIENFKETGGINSKLNTEEINGSISYDKSKSDSIGTDYSFKRKIVWKNVLGFIILHLCAFYGYYLCFTQANRHTTIYMVAMIIITGQGVTVGAHRLWSHRSFKVHTFLKVVLLIFQTISGQNCLWVWVRDHRQHHRYSDTDADPHNARRGFFFSHMGWLMSKKHPLVMKMGKTIDMTDLEADPWIMLQKKYYKPLYVIFAILMPIYMPVLCWNEKLWVSLFVSYFGRYIALLHVTWSVNSLAHYSGLKPYDRNIIPVDSKLVSLLSSGEGWHNFHHTFPWDYRTGEWGGVYNMSTSFIDLMTVLGQAYDLKMASKSMISNRMKKTGDGTLYPNIHIKNGTEI